MIHPGHHGESMSMSFNLTPTALAIVVAFALLALFLVTPLVTRRGSRR